MLILITVLLFVMVFVYGYSFQGNLLPPIILLLIGLFVVYITGPAIQYIYAAGPDGVTLIGLALGIIGSFLAGKFFRR